MNRIQELDGLRFFAILAVLAVHFRPPYRPGLDFMSIGWIGVDLFFVLSGFLITTNLVALRSTPNPYRVFYWRRALRIFPPYYAVLAGLLLLQFIQDVHLTTATIVKPIAFLTSFQFLPMLLQNMRDVLQGAPLNWQQVPLDDHFFTTYRDGMNIFWSLSIEEFFYVLWAPIVLKCSRKQLLAVSLLAIGICPVLRALAHEPRYREGFTFLFRFDTLMIGSLLALTWIACHRGHIARSTLKRAYIAMGVLSFLGLVPIAIQGGLFRHMELRSALGFAVFGYTCVGFFFASVVGLCAMYSGSGLWWARLLRARPLVYVGTVSYMLYLIHLPVFVTLFKVSRRLDVPALSGGLPLAFLSAATALGLAALSWRFFEKPLLRFKDASFVTRLNITEIELKEYSTETRMEPASVGHFH